MVHLTPILLMVLPLGTIISALPQTSELAATPTARAAPAPKNATIQDLETHPMQFPVLNSAIQPIPGAASNKTLIAVMPQLQDIVNNATQAPALMTREVNELQL
jgi:hypothetical protein